MGEVQRVCIWEVVCSIDLCQLLRESTMRSESSFNHNEDSRNRVFATILNSLSCAATSINQVREGFNNCKWGHYSKQFQGI